MSRYTATYSPATDAAYVTGIIPYTRTGKVRKDTRDAIIAAAQAVHPNVTPYWDVRYDWHTEGVHIVHFNYS